MSDEQSGFSNAEECLDEAFAAYIQAKESGHPPDTEAFLTQYPALAQDVAADERFEGLTANVRGMASTGAYVLAEPPSVPSGTVIGDYEVLQEIGRHGQGVVYKARHVKFKQQVVALKMLLSGRRATEKEVQRFIGEVENQAKLDHSNIVPIFGGGEHEGRLYFTMKLIEEGDLAQRTSGKPMSSREAATLMVKTARAVHHAHQRGIFHRDLKPSNILLDAEGEPYVADLGLSKRVESEEPTNVAYMVGAAPFVAPEQIRGETTAVSDVYGLGAVFYWLLTDRPPFRGETREETLRQVLEEDPERPRTVKAHLDRDLEAVCLKCLKKDPDERYRSAEGLARDLDQWLAGRETTARKWSPAHRSWRWCRRNPAVASLSSLAILLLTAVALVATVGYVRTEAARREAETFRYAFADIIDYDYQKQRVEKVATDPDFVKMLVEALRDPNLAELRQKLNGTGLDPKYRKELKRQFQVHVKRTELQDWMERRKKKDDQQPVAIFNWFVTDPEGLQLARGPFATESIGRNFAYRTYFQNGPIDRDPNSDFRAGPQDRLTSTRMSAVFFGQVSGWLVAVSTPVFDGGEFLGVVGLMVEIGPVHPVSEAK